MPPPARPADVRADSSLGNDSKVAVYAALWGVGKLSTHMRSRLRLTASFSTVVSHVSVHAVVGWSRGPKQTLGVPSMPGA
jgi:hypothetical protein